MDAQTCRLVVLDRAVGSTTEFKQIVGRGTRVHEDTQEFSFTLFDFRGAGNHCADPDFDGDPVQIHAPGEDDPVAPPDGFAEEGQDGFGVPPGEMVVDRPGQDDPVTTGGGGGGRLKVFVDGVGACIVAERVEYLDAGGKLVTESLRDCTKAALRRRHASLDDFLKRWRSVERKGAVLDEPAAEGCRSTSSPASSGSTSPPSTSSATSPSTGRR